MRPCTRGIATCRARSRPAATAGSRTVIARTSCTNARHAASGRSARARSLNSGQTRASSGEMGSTSTAATERLSAPIGLRIRPACRGGRRAGYNGNASFDRRSPGELNRLVFDQGGTMPRYVTLINWTDQGVKNFKDSVDRYEAAQEALSKTGVSFTDIYWTVGPYDLVG